MRFPPAATPMSRTLPLLLLAATFALAGCDRDAAPATDGPDASAAPDATAEETYLGADGEAVFTQAGKWVQEDGDGVSFHLDPDTPGGRRYALRADGSLDLLDSHGAPLEPAGHYRLQRL